MPLSAAVHDLPHCGREQRGIDFFFKSSPVLTSAVAQEKRDILAYFKRVEIAKDQEDQNYKSSLSSNTDDTDCSLFSSEEEEIKPGKNGKVSSKENNSSVSENCNKNVSIKERTELANRSKKTSVDSIDLTDETEHSGENVLSAKGQNLRMCNNNAKSTKNTKDSGKSDNTKDEKISTVNADLISDCEEGTIKGESDPHGCGSSGSKSKECLEMVSNAATRGKEQVKSSSPSDNLTEVKKNAFTFMMANRARQTEAGKHSAEEEDGNSQMSGDDCVTVSNNPSQNCETAAKSTVSVNPGVPKKKSREIKSDKEIENEDKATDLNSSLQDFDLTPYEKHKRRRIKKPRTIKEDDTDMNSCMEVAAPSDPPNHNPEERTPNYISFADYMKSACSMAQEIAIEERIVKEADELMKNEASMSKCEINEPHQQQTPNSDPDCTKDDRECSKDALKENINGSLGCDELVKKKKLSCSSEKLDEKQEVQVDHQDTEAVPKSKQVTAKVKRKRTRKKILMSSDSEEDFMMSKSAGVSKKKEDSKSCDKLPMVSNTTRISSFFKKINQKENDEEENKVIFTVQADVHAPLDGNKKTERKLSSPAHTQACGESGDASSITKKEAAPNICSMKKNTKKIKKGMHNNCNLDELNKIELLEQIPPSKPLSKKVLNKCVEGKSSEVEKMSDHAKAEVCNTMKAKSKVTLASKKGSITTRKESLRDTTGAGKKLLRRKKAQSASSEEESPDELFFRKKKKNEPQQSNKDVTVTSTSSSSSSTGSSGDCPEDAEEKSTSILQSSPEASEDDKENVAHYTSQLVRRPGKLSLRIRRVHLPQETCRKEKLKQRKANKITEQLKKGKISRNNKKKRRLCTTLKQKSPKEGANKDSADADGAPLVKHDLITLNDDDDDDADNSTTKQIPKKATRRGKVIQTLLKPHIPKSSPKGRLQKKGSVLSRESPRSESELQGGTQRRTPRRAAATAKKYTEEATIDDEEDKPKKADKNPRKLIPNKGMKLAPIFCKRPTSPCVELLKIVPLSPSKLKARQEFLNSSVSDDVRKQLAVEKGGEDEALAWPPFPVVSHIQQKEEGAAPWNLKDPKIPLKEDPSYSPSLENLTFTQDQKVLSRRNAPQDEPSYHVPRLELGDIVFSLSCMKSKYPDFPVYEVFKAYYDLKKEAVEAYQKEIQKEQTVIHLDDDDDDDEGNSVKKRKRKRKNKLSTLGRGKRRKLGSGKETEEETPQNQQEEVQSVWHERTPHMWTQIFMPKNAKQVIGNAENVKKLKLWLQEWKTKPQIKPKKRKKKSSRKDDFLVSDESSIGDEEEEFVSTYLLSGPPGVGKTAAVYALANELGYKVLEVNASSRRPGRQVMSQLAEATQSHNVSNTSATSHSSNAFSALFAARMSSSMTKKENSQTDASTHDKDSSKMKGVSLVLFEDIDIVFEEWDDGFMSTVNSLMSTTKRPIILTATHTSPVILSQIKESFEIMEFFLPPQKLTAQHLQLVALANGCHICLQDVECLVHLNKGDIRKSMLDLQLLSQPGSSHDICDCAAPENTQDKHTEDSWREIFPETKTLIHKKPNQIEFYKVGLRRRLDARTDFNAFIPGSDSKCLYDKEGICWKEIESNINCILPFPVSEKKNSLLKYPLQPDDPLLKRSSLWQYESLINPDDGEEKKTDPVIEQPEKKVNLPEIQKASQSCLESLANMYDSLAQLDILSSSQITTHAAEIKDTGWWVKQPTAGLSDNPSPSHPHWTPHSNEGIIQELAQKSVTCCVGQVVSALEGVSAKDWPQLCLPCDRKDETQNCVVQSSNYERERAKKRSVISRIFDHLPAVSQVSRSAGLDYLPALRNLAREDELGVALGRGRRGRRFLSHFLQLGWSVSPEDRISLANSFIT